MGHLISSAGAQESGTVGLGQNQRRTAAAGIIAAGLLLALHPRVGVRDGDAYAYIIGAIQLRAGHGYKDLLGGSLNHFPPGYSALLAIFPDPFIAAALINALAFGLACVAVYQLLRQADWNNTSATGLSCAIGAGLFRILATAAHPDILCYAMFLWAVLLYRRNRRAAAFAILVLTIPFKLIGVVFVPALALYEVLQRRPWKPLLLPVLAWAAAIAALLVFNRISAGETIPRSHEAGGLAVMVDALMQLAKSFVRDLLAPWYGSVKSGIGRIVFAAELITALAALLTLRRGSRTFVLLGASVVGITALLELVRQFGGVLRLTGYGVLLLLAGGQPVQRANALWATYGAVVLLAGLFNLVTVPSNGANDRVYQEIGQRAGRELPAGLIATNSFHVVDLHARRPSVEVAPENAPDSVRYYLEVRKEIPDPQSTIVIPVRVDTAMWRRYRVWSDAVIYQRR